ncbi:MAG: class I SAM-dependent methyltransferase, partial [Candidatus Lokiarchaeota archaeon]|nr:class I SAM-dependent methyltransferase [Candidatus Lokiarchaeota archaeon]
MPRFNKFTCFFKMLPDINDLKGIDIGCGEGYNTRIAAKRGAELIAIDISEVFIASAKENEMQEPLGIKYQVASAINLPFPDEFFDFAMATMSLMDISNTEKALS